MREPDEVEGRLRALLDAVGAVKISRHIDGLGFEVPQLPGLLLQLKSADA